MTTTTVQTENVYRLNVTPGKLFSRDELWRLRMEIDHTLQHVDNGYDVKNIVWVVGSKFGVLPEEIFSRVRTDRIAFARQIAMTLIYERLRLTLIETGRLFNRDHGTVIHAIKTVNQRKQQRDGQIIAAIEEALA